MLRAELNDTLKASLKSRDECAVRTIRLVLAALKDRDICARSQGVDDGVGDDEVLALLQTMVKQRRESIRLFEEGDRPELAERERAEIAVIERFMPRPLGDGEIGDAVRDAIRETGARGMKDMGRTMALLKSRYPGRMDFSKASGLVRQTLAG